MYEARVPRFVVIQKSLLLFEIKFVKLIVSPEVESKENQSHGYGSIYTVQSTYICRIQSFVWRLPKY
jgi:hypothetical protein